MLHMSTHWLFHVVSYLPDAKLGAGTRLDLHMVSIDLGKRFKVCCTPWARFTPFA